MPSRRRQSPLDPVHAKPLSDLRLKILLITNSLRLTPPRPAYPAHARARPRFVTPPIAGSSPLLGIPLLFHYRTGQRVLNSLTGLLLTMSLGHAKFPLAPHANTCFHGSKCLLRMFASSRGVATSRLGCAYVRLWARSQNARSDRAEL